MTEQTNDDIIVITRKKLIELMNLQCRMRYMLTLLGAICCKKKLEYMMMPQDVCDFLKIDYKTFEKTLSKVAPKCTFWQGGKVYTLEQMVNVAEIATRPQRLKKILPPTNPATASGKNNNLFYIFENGTLAEASRVALEITATYDADGNASTTADRMEVVYTIPLTGKAGGEIARNGYYRVAANITGLVGQDCQVSVSVAEWESPVTQSVDLGA